MQPELPEVLVNQFRQLQNRLRGTSALGGLGFTAIIAAVCVIVSIGVDLSFDLPLWLRATMLVVSLLLVALTMILWVVRPMLRRYEPTELAAYVELQNPDFDERLLSTVELLSAPDPNASPLMKHWLFRETADLTKRTDFSDAVDARRAVRYCWGGGIAVLALLLPLLFVGPAYGVLFARFVNPWGNYERVHNLMLTVVDGDRTVARHSDVTFQVEADWRLTPGELPESAWLHWTDNHGSTDQRRLDWNSESECYEGTLARVENGFRYFVRADGSKTREHDIQVVDRPEMTAFQIVLTPPAYTGLPAQQHDLVLGEIIALEQSLWMIDAEFNKPIVEAEILWLDGPARPDLEPLDDGTAIASITPLNIDPSGLVAHLEERLDQSHPSGRFQLRLQDADGLTTVLSGSRRLTIAEDLPPTIAFGDNESLTSARPDDLFPVPIIASDDYGVDQLELHCEIVRSPQLTEERVFRVDQRQLGERHVENLFELDLAQFKLSEGMRIAYRARAVDERPIPAPNETWTVKRFLPIRLDAKPYGDQTFAQRQQQTEEALKNLKSQLESQREKTEELKKQAELDVAKDNNWDNQEDVAQVREKLEKLQQQMEQLAAHMNQQPLMNQVSSQLQNAAQEPLAQAQENLNDADQAELPDKAEEFEQAIRNMLKTEKQLDQVQQDYSEAADLQRDLLELNRLAHQSERLADRVEDLEQRKSQIGEEGDALTPEQSRARQEWNLDHRDASNAQRNLSRELSELMKRQPELESSARTSVERKLAEIAHKAGQLAEEQNDIAKTHRQQAQELAKETKSLRQQEQKLANELRKAIQSLEEERDTPEEGRRTNPATHLEDAAKHLQRGDLGEALESHQKAQQVAADRLAEAQESEGSESASQLEKLIEDMKTSGQQLQQGQQNEERSENNDKRPEQGERPTNEESPANSDRSDQSEERPNGSEESASRPTSDRENDSVQGESSERSPVEASQDRVLEETDSLADEFVRTEDEFAALPTPNSSQSERRLREAKKSVSQAREQMEQAETATQQQNRTQSAHSAREAARSLEQAARNARELAGDQFQPSEMNTKTNPSDQNTASGENASSPDSAPMGSESMGSESMSASDANSESEKPTQDSGSEMNQSSQSEQGQGEQGQGEQGQGEQGQGEQGQGEQGQGEQGQGEQGQGEQGQGEQGQGQQGQGQQGQGQQQEESLISDGVGEQVASAGGHLQAAGRMLKQLGQLSSGENGDQQQASQEDQQTDSGDMEASDEGGSEGQQPSEQGSQSEQQPSSSSQALRQAAKSMRQAAGKMGMAQPGQQKPGSKPEGQQPGSSPSSESSEFGVDQLVDLSDLNLQIQSSDARDWGQLPGELQTELLNSARKRPSGEYSKLIRNYFEEIFRSRPPEVQAD
ncbi:hypothetical protein KOR42_28370 [Thalassoglobus neptunius]|uniref:Uncharacterized protein n=1 Tax=Thalassoglobus neptunius TaxID=1938619 RepID=A0A5C5WZD2_9PLAN|nr:hypothetical protein [Thalassoglobus neptunius]TWT55451.1 hypothetical protein KOR42_28370 [Thalassoglobus neptunius]